jgi:hypothetical protein
LRHGRPRAGGDHGTAPADEAHAAREPPAGRTRLLIFVLAKCGISYAVTGGWVFAMRSMNLTISVRKRAEDVRSPVVKGLPDDVYHMLHHSFVNILKMRRSIESVDARLNASMRAVIQSWEVLKRVSDGDRLLRGARTGARTPGG